MRFAYPYVLDPAPEGGFSVHFPDVPEALTQGETEAECATMAEDCLVTALSFYTDASEPLPAPSPARGRPVAIVPPVAAAKLALHAAKLAAGLSTADLARRLEMDQKSVARLLDPLHRSRIEYVAAALRRMGKQIVLDVRDAA